MNTSLYELSKSIILENINKSNVTIDDLNQFKLDISTRVNDEDLKALLSGAHFVKTKCMFDKLKERSATTKFKLELSEIYYESVLNQLKFAKI